MVMWVNWSFLFSTQQWAHLIIFFMPVIQMDLWGISILFIIYSSGGQDTRTWPNSSGCSGSSRFAKTLPKCNTGAKTYMWDPFSNAPLVLTVFYLHCTFLSCSSASKPQLFYSDFSFHVTSIFLHRIPYCHTHFPEKVDTILLFFSLSFQFPTWTDTAVRGSSRKFLFIIDPVPFLFSWED